MMRMGISESGATKKTRMQEAVLANANAQLEKEADPDGVMRLEHRFASFQPRQSVKEAGSRSIASEFAAIKKNMMPAVSVIDKEGCKKEFVSELLNLKTNFFLNSGLEF